MLAEKKYGNFRQKITQNYPKITRLLPWITKSYLKITENYPKITWKYAHYLSRTVQNKIQQP